MAKFIIENQSSASDVSALGLVMEVVSDGKISKDCTQYCYVTVFTTNTGDFAVYADKNKKSFKFIILDGKRREQ